MMFGRKRTFVGALLVGITVASCAGTSQAAPQRVVHDQRSDARVVRRLPFDHASTTRGATTSPAEDPRTPCYGRPAATVWYSWRAPRPMVLGAHTVGSGYLTTIGVFRTHGGDLRSVACSRPTFRGAEGRLTFEAKKGVRYLIAVGARNGGRGGALRLRLTRAIRPAGERLGFTFGFLHQYRTQAGEPRVRIGFDCKGPATVVVSHGHLRQSVGGVDVAHQPFSDRFACEGRTTRTYTGVRGFVPGPAMVDFRVQADTFSMAVDHSMSRTVLLVDSAAVGAGDRQGYLRLGTGRVT
jgi:hypothetical protein